MECWTELDGGTEDRGSYTPFKSIPNCRKCLWWGNTTILNTPTFWKSGKQFLAAFSKLLAFSSRQKETSPKQLATVFKRSTQRSRWTSTPLFVPSPTKVDLSPARLNGINTGTISCMEIWISWTILGLKQNRTVILGKTKRWDWLLFLYEWTIYHSVRYVVLLELL